MSEISVKNVTIRWLGHSSFEITGTKKVYIDPFVIPDNAEKADYILVSHEHFDHCDVGNIKSLSRDDTRIIGPLDCIKKLTGLTNSIKPSEYFSYKDGVRVDAVEAYNIDKFGPGEQVYHPKEFGVGFILIIDGVKIYHAGDTDNIPEMSRLANESIDVALLPIGGTYTMTVAEATQAAKAVAPKQVIPIHYNSDKYGISGIKTDPSQLSKLLQGTGIEVKILTPFV